MKIKKQKIKSGKIQRALFDVFFTWMEEFRAIFKDPGVLVLFLLAPLAYPVLYGMIYKNEILRDVPIAVVDHSSSEWSRRFIRELDATPEVMIIRGCLSKEEAFRLYQERKVHGIVIISENFQQDIYRNRQTAVSAYADMSSFLYYKSLMTAVGFVSRDLGIQIQTNRLMADGLSYQQAVSFVNPYTITHVPLYNSQGGYASFLLPAILILILHQTLLIGIGMRAGTDYERDPLVNLNRILGHRQSVFGMLIGKSLCYLSLYYIITFYVLGLVPHWFQLPDVGNTGVVFIFMLPFLLATIFFAQTIATFLRSRENSMLLFLFTSIPLLFLSGIPWPMSAIPDYWKFIGWLLPSTHGIQGYVRINTMGASLNAVWSEYLSLWMLTGFYFMTAYLSRLWQLHLLKKEKRTS